MSIFIFDDYSTSKKKEKKKKHKINEMKREENGKTEILNYYLSYVFKKIKNRFLKK